MTVKQALKRTLKRGLPITLIPLMLSACGLFFPSEIFTPEPGASPRATRPASATPSAEGHYEHLRTDVYLLDGQTLGFRPESDEEIRRVVASKGLEWREGSVTARVQQEFSGRVNRQTANMTWTPPPTRIQRGQVLSLKPTLNLLENDTDLFLSQSLDVAVDVGDIGPGMATGGAYSLLKTPIEINKDTPKGTLIDGGMLKPLNWGGSELTIRVSCFSGQLGANYHYRYRWVE